MRRTFVCLDVIIVSASAYARTMTSSVVARSSEGRRRVLPRRYLMCPPTYFDVTYAINPWMDPQRPVDTGLALAQWTDLVEAYRAFGHRVDLLEAEPGLPDMVFTANGATVVDGKILLARFANSERSGEETAHQAWHEQHGATYGGGPVAVPVAVNEAEGDFAVLGDVVLAGYGFRTSTAAHRELGDLTGREVLGLQLVDARFYHLDVALAVLDDGAGHIAYFPGAFAEESRRLLASRYPDAVLVDEDDALGFGLNSVSDGLNVFVPAQAVTFARDLRLAGYRPVPIDLSEFRKAGGSIKCVTQEIRSAVPTSVRTEEPR
jgi:N-dimethylarginine dimethylaminohydrolase